MDDNKCPTCGYQVQVVDGKKSACWSCKPLIDLVTGEKCLNCTWQGPYLVRSCQVHEK